MTRIVHLSDLHLVKPEASVLPDEGSGFWKGLAEHCLKEFGVEPNVGRHDPFRLATLHNAIDELDPDVIVVTGDLTTYGDVESMEFAYGQLQF